MLDLSTTRTQKALEITGREPQKAVRLQLAQLRTDGILVDLDITGTGMFQKTPNWLELGIPDFAGDKRTAQFTKGAKYLYPEEKVAKLKSFESRLRKNLDKFSFDVSGFRPYRWLPYTAYQSWRAKHDQIVAEANQYIQAEILDCHDACVDYVAAAYTEIAEAAWIGVTTGESPNGRRTQLYKYVQVWDQIKRESVALDHDGFVDYIVKQAVNQVPTVEQIMNKLSFDYTTGLVYGQEDIAADEAAAQNIRAQVSFEREKASLELSMKREQARAEAWKIQAEQQQKEQLIEAMRAAEYDHRRQQLQETVSPFVEIYRQAVWQFIEHAKDMLESIKKNKHVRGKVAERGRGLLDIYNLLVIPGMGDDRMESYLKELRGLIGTNNSDSRSTEDITRKLQEIVDMEKEFAADLLTTPTSFRYIEID